MQLRTLAAFAALAGLAPVPLVAAEPEPPKLVLAFEETVLLGKGIIVGQTPRGGRNIVPIVGGTFEGPGLDGEGIKGVIIPGGWDWQLVRADGCIEVEADYMLQTDDEVVINVINTGVLCLPEGSGPPKPARTQPRFEAPLGKYEWLGKSAFIGTLEVAGTPEEPAVKIRFYRAD